MIDEEETQKGELASYSQREVNRVSLGDILGKCGGNREFLEEPERSPRVAKRRLEAVDLKNKDLREDVWHTLAINSCRSLLGDTASASVRIPDTILAPYCNIRPNFSLKSAFVNALLNIFICSITMSVMITLRDISGPMHSHEIPHLILFFPFFFHHGVTDPEMPATVERDRQKLHVHSRARFQEWAYR